METKLGNKNGEAIASLVLGLIGLLVWLLPILGVPLTIIGLVLGVYSRTSPKRKLAIAGIVLCIIGLLASITNSALGVYMLTTGKLDISNSIISDLANIKTGQVIFCADTDDEVNPIDASDTFSPGTFYARLETLTISKETTVRVTIYKQDGDTDNVYDIFDQLVSEEWNILATEVKLDTPGKYKVVFTNSNDGEKYGEGIVTIK